jgi:hypothetical protein
MRPRRKDVLITTGVGVILGMLLITVDLPFSGTDYLARCQLCSLFTNYDYGLWLGEILDFVIGMLLSIFFYALYLYSETREVKVR